MVERGARALDGARGRRLPAPRRVVPRLELDLDGRAALVEPFTGDYYTQPKSETHDRHRGAEHRASGGSASSSPSAGVGDRAGGRLPAAVDPRPGDARPRRARPARRTTFETEAIWFVPPDEQLDGLEPCPKLLGTLHAAEHALIALLPLWAMCDRWDIGGLSTNLHFQTGRPTVFVYDGHPGGVGIAERGFDQFEGWVADTAHARRLSLCRAGCPSCVQSPKCGNLNECSTRRRADPPPPDARRRGLEQSFATLGRRRGPG